MNPTDTPSIGRGYILVVFIILIYVFNQRKVVYKMMLVLVKDAHSVLGLQQMDCDIDLILAETER